MYICICNGLTDREARSKSNSSFYSVAEFYRAMGVKPKCGKCIPAVREILESAAGENGAGSVPRARESRRIDCAACLPGRPLIPYGR